MNIPQRSFRTFSTAQQDIAAHIDEFIALRHDIHAHPELAHKEFRTSDRVASLLRTWGYEVATGIAGTGVVGTLKRGNGKRNLAIRADLDALPIEENTGLAYASTNKGVMHACGHDGHTTILLAAARYLAENGHFDGTLNLVFQPAEEIGAGAKAMLSDGLFERFPADAIFGLHNWPGLAERAFGFVDGPAMASVDKASIRIIGKGGHGAEPHNTVDPVVASASLITVLQTVVSRNVDPRQMAVISVGSIHGGSASNVIPEHVDLEVTIRAYSADVRGTLQQRITALVQAQAESFGATAKVIYKLGIPSVVNHENETVFAKAVAASLFDRSAIKSDFPPRTASEDFAYFLQAKPGSFLFVGNGDSAPLHSANYDFNDNIIAPAALYWVALAEAYLNDSRG